ncbi:hypothetical protein DAMA08_001260 [Martiniozyma asiatica (nom. inval.)]|nr:hypothetical protein DAMA08_001260 [Martiniozyma asiatica]
MASSPHVDKSYYPIWSRNDRSCSCVNCEDDLHNYFLVCSSGSYCSFLTVSGLSCFGNIDQMRFLSYSVPHIKLDVVDADFRESRGAMCFKRNAKSIHVNCHEDVGRVRVNNQLKYCKAKAIKWSCRISNLYHAADLPNVKTIQVLTFSLTQKDISDLCLFVKYWGTLDRKDNVELIFPDRIDLRAKRRTDGMKPYAMTLTPRIDAEYEGSPIQYLNYVNGLRIVGPNFNKLNLDQMKNLC